MRRSYLILLGIIAAGLISRLTHTGAPLIDKYLGDALYAAAVYVVLHILAAEATPCRTALAAAGVMAAIETFQLTGIPAQLLAGELLPLRLLARLLGTHFSFYDLLAYAAAIAICFFIHRRRRE